MRWDKEQILRNYPISVRRFARQLQDQTPGTRVTTLAMLAFYLCPRFKDRVALCAMVLDGLLTDETDADE